MDSPNDPEAIVDVDLRRRRGTRALAVAAVCSIALLLATVAVALELRGSDGRASASRRAGATANPSTEIAAVNGPAPPPGAPPSPGAEPGAGPAATKAAANSASQQATPAAAKPGVKSAGKPSGKPAVDEAAIVESPLAPEVEDLDETPRPVDAGAPLDSYTRTEILASLAPVHPLLTKCYGESLGVAYLKMTIAATGKVIGATVTGAIAGTPIAECFSDAAKKAIFRPSRREITTLIWHFGRRTAEKVADADGAGAPTSAPLAPAAASPDPDEGPAPAAREP